MRIAFSLVVCAVIAGCMTLPPHRPEPSYRPAYPSMEPPPAAEQGALFQAGYGVSLFDDRRATRVGDIVTIRLQERTQSSKSAETTISKGSSTSVIEPTVFGETLSNAVTNLGSDSDFAGAAESDQSNSLSGTISAVVTAVYPNGLLLVQGEKWLNLNRGEEYVRVSGLVRREDIDGTNAVSSLRLADARFAYSGTGALADSNAPGWFTRFFLSPFMPY